MKNLKILALLFFSVAIYAQDDSKWYKQYTMKFNQANDILYNDIKNPKLTKDYWYSVAHNIVNSDTVPNLDKKTLNLKAELAKSFSGKEVNIGLSKSDWAIIMVSHISDTNRLGVFGYDKKKLNIVLLHRERKKGEINKYEWSENLLNTKNFMVIFLGNTGIDADGKAIDNAIKYSKKESFFFSSGKDLVKLIRDTDLQAAGSDTVGDFGEGDNLYCKLIINKKRKLKSPSEISFKSPYLAEKLDTTVKAEIIVEEYVFNDSTPYKNYLKSHELIKDKEPKGKPKYPKGRIIYNPPTFKYEPDFTTQKIVIHEKNRFAFTIGASLSQFNYQNFSLDSTRNVVIAGDSSDIANWKSNFNLNIEYYPFGRDIDNFESVFKAGFRDFHTRFGLVGGVKLSKDPFEVIHGGIVFSVSKTFSVTAGFTWDKEQVNLDGTTEERPVSTLTDLKSVKTLFNQYGRSNFTVGISLAPSEVIKLLKD